MTASKTPAFPKPEPARKAKRHRYLENRTAVRELRDDVFAREQQTCAVVSRLSKAEMVAVFQRFGICTGSLTLAHLAGARRSQTRNQPVDERHHSARALCLCELHHDAEERKGLRFIGQTDRGMDGPITTRVEPPKSMGVS
jgi:hypothetical protein